MSNAQGKERDDQPLSENERVDGDQAPRLPDGHHRVEYRDVASITKQVLSKIASESEHSGLISLKEPIVAEIVEEVLQITSESFQGPLPPPRMLRAYEDLMPGLAAQIVARSDKEQAFRHEMTRASHQLDRHEVEGDCTLRSRAQT